MRSPHRLALLSAALVILAVRPAAADNPHLEQARAQKLALDYQAALVSLRQAHALGTSGPGELAEIFRLSGEIEAGLGNSAAATSHFKQLLAIAPASRLPAGTSPKLAAPFARAREFYRGRQPLTVSYAEVDGPALLITIVADPLAMVAGAGVSYREAGTSAAAATSEGLGVGRVKLALPVADALEIELWVFDAHGNRLLVMGHDPPITLGARHDPDAELAISAASAPSPGPLYARWYTWAGVAVVSAGLGGYFALATRAADRDLDELNAESESHDYADAKAIASDGHRNALLTNISFAVAATSAIAATVFLLRRPARDKRKASLRTGPTLTGAGAGLFVAADF